MSRADVVWRGVLYVLLAVIALILGSEYWHTHLPEPVMQSLALLSAGLIALRAYIDQSVTIASTNPGGNT